MRRGRGFTLLEMMIALAILALAMTWMVTATARAISVSNHAKLIATATFLARGRMTELEDDIAAKGFTDDSLTKEDCGDFEDQGFKRFKWCVVVDKVELPSQDQVQSMMTQALQDKQSQAGGSGGGSDPLSSLTGGAMPGMMGGMGGMGGSGGAGSMMSAGAGLLGSQFGMIKQVLENGIRRAHCRVMWTESGKDKNVELVEYLTDPRRVDMAISMPNLAGIPGLGGNGQQPQQPGGSSQSGNAANMGSIPRIQ